MNFKEEHIPILEQHKHHWIGLRDIGIMRNLDAPIVKSLQQVFNESIGPQKFSTWCPDCITEMVRLLYINFERWQEAQALLVSEVTIPEGGGTSGKKGRKKKNEEDGK